MIVYHSFDDIAFDKDTVLTIGTFDGVHRGHTMVLDLLVQRAVEHKARNFVLTFHPHPQVVLQRPDREPIQLLTTMQERITLLQAKDIDGVIVIPFSDDFASISAEDFVREILCKKIGLQHIIIGYDHSFGKGRKGNAVLLEQLGADLGFTVEQYTSLTYNDETISSTKIRRALKATELGYANTMLGYPYRVTGKVVSGDGRGRRLGIPTANIQPGDVNKLLPHNGVYLVSSLIDGVNVYGMANIGTRPTFTDDIHPRLEVHFLSFNRALYDKELTVSFLKFIRKERKFESFDLFLSQVFDDRDVCLDAIEQLEKGQDLS